MRGGIASCKMRLFKFLVLCIAVIVAGIFELVQSAVVIHFNETPPKFSRLSTAVFKYSVGGSDGKNPCIDNGCLVGCELDGRTLRSCSTDSTLLRNLTVNQEHTFMLNVTAQNGDRNSSSYSWFIDTVPPTATLSTEDNYTNVAKVTIDVTFSETCPGFGGFKCFNSSYCDVLVDGSGFVDASSLRAILPNRKYEVDVGLSLEHMYGRVVIRMVNGLCADEAGNSFTRSNSSVIMVHFDRRPVLVDLWMPVSSNVLVINGMTRTVLATNKTEDLKLFLDFSIPIKNSTEEVLSALDVKSASISPALGGHQGSRKFAFQLTNVSCTGIITVELTTSLIIGKTGTPTSPVSPLTILYDSVKPAVGLSSDSQGVTKASGINVVAEFTKPVFGFDSSMIQVDGGKITRFAEHSRALYSFTVVSETQTTLFVSVPAEKVRDISGNQNLASNGIQLNHYSTPATLMSLDSFIMVGVLATSLAAAGLSLSLANIGILAASSLGNTNYVASDPPTNLHGMLGHLQVFVMSGWLSANHPIQYSETIKGLRWLIPHGKLPWRKDQSSMWSNHVRMAEGIEGPVRVEFPNSYGAPNNHSENSISYAFDGFHGQDISTRRPQFGQPLNPAEYFTYFLTGEPMAANSVVKKLGNSKGWDEMAMNLFWLGVITGSLLVLYIFIMLLLRWRTGTSALRIISFPRFGILLLILLLPCISQSAAFVIKGGTVGGIVVGALLLLIPAAFVLSALLFLLLTILPGNLVQYEEIKYVSVREAWYEKLWYLIIDRPVKGKWFYRGGSSGSTSSFLHNLGILFENQKGPALFFFVDQNDESTFPKRMESGHSGVGRMRAISSNDSNEEITVPASRKIFGYARSCYIVLDLIRRAGLGVISGAYSKHHKIANLLALTITMTQFIYLTTLKPYIRRRIHAVESISLLCESGVFFISMATNTPYSSFLGDVMLGLLLLSTIAQITNEWYSMISCLLRLSWREQRSFRQTLGFATRGLFVPFLPKKKWPSSSTQPKTGFSSVLPLSPNSDHGMRDENVSRLDSFRATSATVVPVGENVNSGDAGGAGKKGKGVLMMVEQRSELRKLREMARASFYGEGKRRNQMVNDHGGNSYHEAEASSSSKT
ncbi:hypothetical protein LINGRAHAP2_LOCUS34330 [Linum grandiflorum]